MNNYKFLQIHSLHGYTSVLLNRDDSGLAKRLLYGGATRTRVSSQCLKRHWRMDKGAYALSNIDGVDVGVRSRELVTKRIIQPLVREDAKVVDVINETFQKAVYGDKGAAKGSRQPLLLGEQEINYLAGEAQKIADESHGNAKQAKELCAAWQKDSKKNLKALRESCILPGGVAAALFGRMVTSDPEANIDACVHVAHSFTVHAEEVETDYFTVVDDLRAADEDAGASHIGETELTSGLFYGYTAIDREMLLNNLGGDPAVASKAISRLIKLIATVSPGAKLGPTAPYGYASWMLVEASNWQPCSLAEAFRTPCKPEVHTAVNRIVARLVGLGEVYPSGERRHLWVNGNTVPELGDRLPLSELADWSARTLVQGSV